MRYWNIKPELTVLVVLLIAGYAKGQRTEVSPYSAYGLGQLAEQQLAEQRLMGGISLSSTEAYQLSPGMPAGYANLKKTVFSVSGRAKFVELTSSADTRKQRNARFMGFAIGMPFGQGKWGLGFGLMPETSVGYRLYDTDLIPGSGSNVDFEYTGEGGLNRAFFGMSRELWRSGGVDTTGVGHRLTFGANANYLFGTVNSARRAVYPRSEGFFNTNATAEIIVRDPVFNTGLQHTIYGMDTKGEKQRPWHITAGLFVEMPASLKTKRTDLVTTFVRSTSGVEFTRDTVEFVQGATGKLKLPAAYGIGLSYVWNRKLTLAIEHRRRDWSKLSSDIEGWDPAGELGERSSYSFGIAYLPAGKDDRVFTSSFLESCIYRAGFRYVNDYLVLQGRQLSEIGISFGTSFPVLRSMTRSYLTIGAELGRRGTTQDNLIQERYTELIIGISITPELREPWFRKRKIE